MRKIRGSNQFEDKHGYPTTAIGSVAFIISIVLPIVIFLGIVNQQTKKHLANASTEKVVVKTTPTPTVSPILTVKTVAEQESIEAYVKMIFGKDSKVAIAIQHDECNPQRPEYPRCINHSAIEYSIGIFQINIQSQTTKVHFSRIPGDTLEEKIQWLKDPYNNTLMAYWIFSKSGFYPWTTYKTGSYLRNL